MKQEDKELLLKDLCARLPYGVRCDINGEVDILDSICDDDGYYFNFIGENKEGYTLDEVKPYLFPLSSMTEEQDKEFALLQTNPGQEGFLYAWNCATMMKWLIENNFDYNGLIPKGLAKDATGLNIY